MVAGGGSVLLLKWIPAVNPLEEPILTALPISLITLVVLTLAMPATNCKKAKEDT
jgi:hypothetical protein